MTDERKIEETRFLLLAAAGVEPYATWHREEQEHDRKHDALLLLWAELNRAWW